MGALIARVCFSSWPGLSRPSTPLLCKRSQDVDARDKPGHDELC
jgi:error-prone DNA polymerase